MVVRVGPELRHNDPERVLAKLDVVLQGREERQVGLGDVVEIDSDEDQVEKLDEFWDKKTQGGIGIFKGRNRRNRNLAGRSKEVYQKVGDGRYKLVEVEDTFILGGGVEVGISEKLVKSDEVHRRETDTEIRISDGEEEIGWLKEYRLANLSEVWGLMYGRDEGTLVSVAGRYSYRTSRVSEDGWIMWWLGSGVCEGKVYFQDWRGEDVMICKRKIILENDRALDSFDPIDEVRRLRSPLSDQRNFEDLDFWVSFDGAFLKNILNGLVAGRYSPGGSIYLESDLDEGKERPVKAMAGFEGWIHPVKGIKLVVKEDEHRGRFFVLEGEVSWIDESTGMTEERRVQRELFVEKGLISDKIEIPGDDWLDEMSLA